MILLHLLFVSLLLTLSYRFVTSDNVNRTIDELHNEIKEQNLRDLPIVIRTTREINATNCPESFEGKCQCRSQHYPHGDSPVQFVVNCTETRFTNADMLEDLPDETEVLIFTGNLLDDLPDNIFGTEFKHEKLKYIDMSNNHITFIRGQTFHRVSKVETLILNFNNMEITDRRERTRLFSNFYSLKYLHLTDAFTDRYNASAYYLLTLADIFTNSYLSQLQRLHMEQNEIFSIGANASIFCPLVSLQHLYLSDNKLTDIEFRLDCLKNLNHIDIRYNMITRLSEDAMAKLDSFVNEGRPLSLNLRNNPLSCDCRSTKFLEWIRSSGVKLDDVENYICMDGYPEENINKNLVDVEHVSCFESTVTVTGYSTGTVGFLGFLIVLMVLVVLAVFYYHKKKLSTLIQPFVSELTSKIGYAGLASEEHPREVNV